MRVLFFGTYDARRHPRVQVLEQGFMEAGDEVLECNVPLPIDTELRVKMLKRPWLLPILLSRLARAWWKLWRMSRASTNIDAVIVGYLGHFDVHLARRLWTSTPIVLDYMISGADTARDRRISSSLLLRLLEGLDHRALAATDIPCVDTSAHAEALPAEHRHRAIVAAVGASREWFGEPRERRSKSSVKVIFFGLYTPAQGAIVIGRAIGELYRRQAPVDFTMVGKGQDLAATRSAAASHPHVRWIDWLEPEDLLREVADHDVCLGIFGTSDKGRRTVPNKVFQGAAAGCAVVTSETMPQVEAFSDAALFVPPDDPQALADHLENLSSDRELLWRMRLAAHKRAEERFRPRAIVEPLRQRLLLGGTN